MNCLERGWIIERFIFFFDSGHLNWRFTQGISLSFWDYFPPSVQLFLMGSLIFKKKQHISNSEVLPHPPEKSISENEVRQEPQIRKPRFQFAGPYDPKPVFRKIPSSKMRAIQKSPVLLELINSQNWIINAQIIEHLRIFNVFEHIQVCNAHALVVSLYRNIVSSCTSKLQMIHEMRKEEPEEASFKERQLKQGPIVQQYSEIYASLFSISFLQLRKLRIYGNNTLHDQCITSLQVLQYLDSPCLEELHADGHNLTNIRFLRKCHWKYLQTLSLRDLKISDSSHFASIMPFISNSRHLETLNLGSDMSNHWYEVSWLLKMGFASAQSEKLQLDQDDDYYYMNEGRVLRRIQFGMPKKAHLLSKHIAMIKRKFNNSYFDNPLVFW